MIAWSVLTLRLKSAPKPLTDDCAGEGGLTKFSVALQYVTKSIYLFIYLFRRQSHVNNEKQQQQNPTHIRARTNTQSYPSNFSQKVGSLPRYCFPDSRDVHSHTNSIAMVKPARQHEHEVPMFIETRRSWGTLLKATFKQGPIRTQRSWVDIWVI